MHDKSARDEELPWDPDRVIPRDRKSPPTLPPRPEEDPALSPEENRLRYRSWLEGLNPEQREYLRQRAERFVWKPGYLRRVNIPENEER